MEIIPVFFTQSWIWYHKAIISPLCGHYPTSLSDKQVQQVSVVNPVPTKSVRPNKNTLMCTPWGRTIYHITFKFLKWSSTREPNNLLPFLKFGIFKKMESLMSSEWHCGQRKPWDNGCQREAIGIVHFAGEQILLFRVLFCGTERLREFFENSWETVPSNLAHRQQIKVYVETAYGK